MGLSRDMLGSAKLQFYPTDEQETWRMLILLGGLEIRDYKKRKSYASDLDEFDEIARSKYGLNRDNEINDFKLKLLFLKLVEEKRFTEAKDLFGFRYFSHSSSTYGEAGAYPVVIADLFAGEGKWLSLYKETAMETGDVYLVANELEKNRFDTITTDANIDEATNLAFEELQMPKHCINVMLYNPPYTSIGGERSAVLYLQQVIERQLLAVPGSLANVAVIAVLRDTDLLKCVPIISREFDLVYCYRTANQVYKQYACLLLKKDVQYQSAFSAAAQLQHDIEATTAYIKGCGAFDPEYLIRETTRAYWYGPIDYRSAKINFNFAQTEKRVESDPNDKPWQFFREITRLHDETKLRITMPRAPKIGEIANLLAAGQLNSEMDIPGGGSHVVIGGTKIVETVQHSEYEGKNKNEECVIIIKKHEPFLNLLVVDQDGKPEIIQLEENADRSSEAESINEKGKSEGE